MLVVLDTNIVVAACLNADGAPATIVELALLLDGIEGSAAKVVPEHTAQSHLTMMITGSWNAQKQPKPTLS